LDFGVLIVVTFLLNLGAENYRALFV